MNRGNKLEYYKAIRDVADRIDALGLRYCGRMSTVMDLEYCAVDVEKLLTFDDANFTHDIAGIDKHFNRETLKFDNCFVPRAGVLA